MAGRKGDAPRDIDSRCAPAAMSEEASGGNPSVLVHIVDDDSSVREALGDLLRSVGYRVELYRSSSEFLGGQLPETASCVLLDVRLPGTSGLSLQQHMIDHDIGMPVILMTAFGDVPMSVKGMKAGAIDFLTEPIRDQDLLDAVAAAIRVDQDRRQETARLADIRARYDQLTQRERQVVMLVASGLLNKQIAAELSISEMTVKLHRGSAMRKLKVRTAASLARLAHVLDDGA